MTQVKGKRLDVEGGIRTRARARAAAEQWSAVPLRVKIVMLLTDAYIECTTQEEESEDEWEEVSGSDDDDDDAGGAAGALAPPAAGPERGTRSGVRSASSLPITA